MEKNLTQGSVVKTIIFFSLPFLVSNFMQTLYGLADLFITGQFTDATVITAVSVGSQIMHMFTVMIVGLAMGSTVMISRAVGANKKKDIAKSIGNSITFFVMAAIAFTGILLVFVKGIVSLVSTPVPSVTDTESYLYICFLGIPFIVAYNVLSAILRGMGDSKNPMYIVGFACVINIGLDYLLIGYMRLGAKGAALGTVIAQGISVCIAVALIIKRQMIKLTVSDFALDKNVIKSVLGIGVPIALQDGFIQVSFMVITIIANRRGVEVAAAVGIVEKIICFLFLVPSSMLSAISAISAQCVGAGLHKRAGKTLVAGMSIAVAVGLIFAIAAQFVANPLIGCFTKDAIVVTLGVQYFRSYVTDCVFAAIHFACSGYFCAYGYSILSFIHNSISIIAIRIPGAYFASKIYPDNLFPMGAAAPLGSLFSDIICIVACIIIYKKVVITLKK